MYFQHDIKSLLDKVQEAIRIRHYSLSTERTYIHWVNQFINYIKETKKGTTEGFILESENVRSYLSYLALRKKVSASTQNQALLRAIDRKSTRLNSSHIPLSRMPSSA